MALDVAPAADWRRWLECALSPMGMEEFFQDYLERQPLHLDRRGPAHYAGLFSLAEMEALLFRGGAMLSARNMMVVRTPPADAAVNRHATEKLPVPDGAGFAAAELPGLDPGSRRVLLTRLLQEGVLRPA